MPAAQKNNTAGMTKLTHLNSALTLCVFAALSVLLTEPARAVSDQKIEGARYACANFIQGDEAESRKKDMERAQIARFWLVSFLTGTFEADEVLEFSEDRENAEGSLFSRIKEYCAENEANSLHAAAVRTAATPRPLPASTALGLDPRLYSCAAYSAGRTSQGETRMLAEAAEFWAFAFVQGTVSARYHPRLVIGVSNKRKIVRALKQSCARNPTRTLLDQTSEIATRVRPEPE